MESITNSMTSPTTTPTSTTTSTSNYTTGKRKNEQTTTTTTDIISMENLEKKSKIENSTVYSDFVVKKYIESAIPYQKIEKNDAKREVSNSIPTNILPLVEKKIKIFLNDNKKSGKQKEKDFFSWVSTLCNPKALKMPRGK